MAWADGGGRPPRRRHARCTQRTGAAPSLDADTGLQEVMTHDADTVVQVVEDAAADRWTGTDLAGVRPTRQPGWLPG